MEPNNTPRMMQANSFYGPANPHGVIHEYWATCDQGVLCKRVPVEPAPAIPNAISEEKFITARNKFWSSLKRNPYNDDCLRQLLCDVGVKIDINKISEAAIPGVDNAPDHHRLMMFNGQRIDQPAHSYRESCCGLKNGRSTCVPLAQFVTGTATAPEPVKPPRQYLVEVVDRKDMDHVLALYERRDIRVQCVSGGAFSVRELPPPVTLTDEVLDRCYESGRDASIASRNTRVTGREYCREFARGLISEYRKLAGYQEEK